MDNAGNKVEKDEPNKSEACFQRACDLPCIFQAGCRGVMLNKNAPNESDFAQSCFLKDMLKTDKLIASSNGDWDIYVYKIPSKYFACREEFDNLIVKEERRKRLFPGESLSTISIEKAFDQLNTKIKVNLDYFFLEDNKNEYKKYVGGDYDIDYYRWCWNEMKELKEKIRKKKLNSSEQYSNLKIQIKKIKSILFFKLMVEIFGENDESIDDENLYNFKDFKLLCYDGNERFASARIGENYLGFVYGTS